MNAPRDYRDTLNLPKTDFAMRAELPKREPDRVRWWAEERVYERRLAANANNEPWILHDGPPYANGNLHMGHFLNRFLKDAFTKIHLLDGKWASFRPGWDMHGLPIELETLKHLGLDYHKIDPIELRAKCRERALHWLDIQRDTILRMGAFGHYDRPYRTIDPSFEQTIVETLADLAQKKQLYKGLRPTLWCIHDETALAEAEIEYADHVSPQIYARFTASADQAKALVARGFEPEGAAVSDSDLPLSVMVWTTTPWSLPGVVAIALAADASYALFDVQHASGTRERIVIAEERADAFALRKDVSVRRIASTSGAELEGASVRHPFLDRDVPFVLADYVELDTGTGAVTTAPGHGPDDFATGARYGLETVMPVDHRGIFNADAGRFAGFEVFTANAAIIDALHESTLGSVVGALFWNGDYSHSYPHCWRCKNPVIFRATAQWFISMDRNGLRQEIIDDIAHVEWTPKWGEGRMKQMIENHPEWCLSRQRTWGTPIPAFACEGCNESIVDPTITRAIAARFGREGSDCWWTDPVEAFVPADFACPSCGGSKLRKEFNIVDIWFESGVTNRAVLGHDGLPWPADLFLEGSDQYRGWFRSNLITAVATKGAAPYKAVVSTGWVNDAEGRAMHKSAGNYIGAEDGMKQYGADVLRLWVASTEWLGDVRLGKAMLEGVGNVYRNLRVRLRYLLSVINDLPADELVAREHMQPLDRLVLARCDALSKAVVEFYREHKLHDAYLALLEFESELSALYIDAVKDRLYSNARDSHSRRSAQSAALEMLRTLCVLLAPILSFTAEEAWQHVRESLRGDARSVFDLEFPAATAVDDGAIEMWNELRDLRARVAGNAEVRDYQLRARVGVPADRFERYLELGDDVREALVVSHLDGIDRIDGPSVTLTLEKAVGEKCSRCWKYLELGIDPLHPTICGPCAQTVRVIDERVA